MSPASFCANGRSSSCGDDVVHQAEPQRFLGIDEVAGERHLDRARQADPLRQQHGDATTRHDPDARVGVGEARALRRDEERALQRELEPARDRHPVDRADHRLRDHRDEAVEPVRVPLGSLAGATRSVGGRDLPAHLLQVDAGAERRIRPGDDHRVDLGILARGAHRVPQGIAERAAQRVARSGTVEGDGRDPVDDVDEQDRVFPIVVHAASRPRPTPWAQPRLRGIPIGRNGQG